MKAAVQKTLLGLGALLVSATGAPGELHSIVEAESGYLFGATADGKWIKAGETGKAVADNTTYRIYGLTQSLGEAKGSKPKATEDVCPDTSTVSLSPKLKRGVIAVAAPWNALPRKPRIIDPTQQVYVDVVRRF